MKVKRCKMEPQEDEAGGISYDAIEIGENQVTVANEAADNNDGGDGAENCELQSPQAQTRWTPECTRVMLQLRFERQLEFHQKIRQKKELWSEIASEMRRQGLCDLSLTAEACDLKYRNMLQTYKKNRLKEDNGMQSLIAWEYYEIFKVALTSVDELEAYQEGNDRVVPSLLCESICDLGSNAESGPEVNVTEKKLLEIEPVVNSSAETTQLDTEDAKVSQNTKPTIVNSRKRNRKSAPIKAESVSPPPVLQTNTGTHSTKSIVPDAAALVENSKRENYTQAVPNESHPQLLNAKPEISGRPQRRRTCTSFNAPTPIVIDETTPAGADTLNEMTMNCIQNDPIISSTSAAPLPTIPPIMLAPPSLQPHSQPQPPHTALPAVSQTPITIVHPNNLQAIPIGLTPSEMRECQVFGESIGLQLAHVREPQLRAMVQLKIQELLYLAKTGKLLETIRV